MEGPPEIPPAASTSLPKVIARNDFKKLDHRTRMLACNYLEKNFAEFEGGKGKLAYLKELVSDEKKSVKKWLRVFLGNIDDELPATQRSIIQRVVLDLARGDGIHIPAHSFADAIACVEQYLKRPLSDFFGEGSVLSDAQLRDGVQHPLPSVSIASRLTELRPKYEMADVPELMNDCVKQRRYVLDHLMELQHLAPPPLLGKLYPPTGAWLVGTDGDSSSENILREMVKIGNEHDIKILTNMEKLPAEAKYLKREAYIDAIYWPQDWANFGYDCLKIAPSGEQLKIREAMSLLIGGLRKQRDPNWADIDGPTGQIGAPWNENFANYGICLANALSIHPVMKLTYNEGGNTIFGRNKAGEPCVIIGIDSFDATRVIFERELGKPVTDAEVRAAFEYDYGTKNIHFIEQPAECHLDMVMAMTADGHLVIDDPRAALELYQPSDTDLEKAEERAERSAYFVDIAAKQLEAAGFTVHRVPGRFYHTPEDAAEVKIMNFFNHVSATTPKGQRIVVALGCVDSTFEERFREMITLGHNPADKAPQIYFLPYPDSKDTLFQDGGISCRTKALPHKGFKPFGEK